MMDINKMDFEEFMEHADEYFDFDEEDSQEIDEEAPVGNPRGAGRYRYTRSSQDSNALFLGKEAGFDPEYNLWIEYMGCGYACWRDGKALTEADEIDLYEFHRTHPLINCKESYIDYEYGNTRDEVAYAFVCLTEYRGTMHRCFSFSLTDVSLQEVEKYIDAIEMWHRTGEFNVGPYSGSPAYDPWCK